MTKLLIIGWDGASQKHLEEFDLDWIQSLEYGGRLLPEPLYQGIPLDSGMAWTAISTGLEVEEHGIISINNITKSLKLLDKVKRVSLKIPSPRLRTYFFYGVNKSVNLKDRTPRSTDVPYKRLWDLWDGKTLTVGVPMTYPAWKTDGVMISGIPGPLDGEEPDAYPEEYSEYRKRFNGFYYQGDSPMSAEDQPNKEGHLDSIEEMTMNAFEVTEEIASEDEFELVFGVFPMIDDSLHVLDPEDERDRIREIYQKMDERSREMVEEIDPDHVIVVSDHGMMPDEESLNPTNYPGKLMDHDPDNGIWRSDLPLELETQPEFTPEVLRQFDMEYRREVLEFDSSGSTEDEEQIKDQLEKMGYLDDQ